MCGPEIIVAGDPDAAAGAAAMEVLRVVHAAVEVRGRATVALAGGTTPALLYGHLAATGREGAPWDRVQFFFGDERCVAPTSPRSNYALARRELFNPLAIAPEAVHRMEGERRPAAMAAEAYERLLRVHFPAPAPAFDLALLGIGADGHTASLFPGSSALGETRRWVVPVRAPAEYAPPERITLTVPMLNRARAVFFLATGESKRPAIATVLGGGPQRLVLPAARVRPAGRLAWFLDDAAAGSLKP